MSTATGIEIASGASAQSVVAAVPPVKAQNSGTVTTGASPTAAATSFRSSWQSLLASLDSTLDGASGNETGSDAALASAGVAPGATTGTASQVGLSQSPLTALTESTAKTQGTGTLTAVATASLATSQSGTFALRTASGLEQQTAAAQTEKNTAKAHAAESTSDTHSAKKAKLETDSAVATEQSSAVPDSTLQFLSAPVQQAAIVTSSGTVPAPVSEIASLPASEAAQAISFGLGDATNGKTSLTASEIGTAGKQATSQVGESGLSGKASSVSAAELESVEPQVAVATGKDSATEKALSRSTLPDSAPASGIAKSLATSSSQMPATPGVRSAASDQSSAPTEASISGGGDAAVAQIPVRAASENQLQSLPSGNNQAQSTGTETLAVTAGGEGLQASALAADSAKSQSSPSSATSTIGKKAGVANAGRTLELATSRTSQLTGAADPMQHNGLSTAVQSGLAVQDGTGLVRDPSVGHGSIGTTGNTAVELAASAASRDGSASRETFSALDAGTPTTPTWIHAGAQRAEAGFQDPSLGWVGVRADSNGGSVHASLVAGSADAAQTLSGHLAGLNAYLADQHTAVGQVTVAATDDRSASYGADQSMNQSMNQGAGQDGSRGQQPVPAASEPAFTSAVSAVSAARTGVSVPGGSLGGTHISLIA